MLSTRRSRHRKGDNRKGNGQRGAIYARYSSRFQHSTDDQVRECRLWAEANGIEVIEEHVFVDQAITGRASRRPGFTAMLQALENNEIDVVITFATSRLSRKTYKALQFVEEKIRDRKRRCVFVKTGIDTADEANWSKLLQIHSIMDEMTGTAQVAHIQAAHQGQLHRGVVFGTLTYGYGGKDIESSKTRRGKAAQTIIIDAATSSWVKRIFQWFADEDVSICEIVRRLNQEKEAPLPQADYHGRAGRHSKDGDRDSPPRFLNGLFYCAKHQRRLIVGGPQGRKLFCPACIGDPERALSLDGPLLAS